MKYLLTRATFGDYVSIVSKKSVGTRVEATVYERLERLAKVDRRNIANVLDLLIHRGLPELESEILRDAPGQLPVGIPEPHVNYRKKSTSNVHVSLEPDSLSLR